MRYTFSKVASVSIALASLRVLGDTLDIRDPKWLMRKLLAVRASSRLGSEQKLRIDGYEEKRKNKFLHTQTSLQEEQASIIPRAQGSLYDPQHASHEPLAVKIV